jgi:3-oxoacyl-[acyl-carrier-protein] synthase-1
VNRDLCVAGIGSCTALGADLWSSAAAVRAGLTAFAEHPYMVDRAGEPMVVARAPYLEVDAPLASRMAFLAARAALYACLEAVGPNRRAVRFPVVVGIPPDLPGLEQTLAASFRDTLGGAAIASLDTVATGHSAALLALEIAAQRIESGSAEWCLVGGVDSYMDPERLEHLEETGQLHSLSNPWGFIPGEGAGFCVITTVRNAEEWGVKPALRIASVASAREANLIRTGSVCIGAGLSTAIRDALSTLPSGAQVDTVVCDINGDAYRADEYGFSIARMSDCFRDATDITTPADSWGDVGAASGILFLGLVIAAAHKGYGKGPHALMWTSSDTGERAAALVEAAIDRPSGDA